MASLSSTGSVTSSSSLGNTSLRGFGGMVSGIDRDEIIEAMTLHTTNKITSQQAEITKLQWKQEAYRSISDQILDLSDKYTSYSSTSSLVDPAAFAKSIITVKGLEDSTRFVQASGTSALVDNVSLAAVKRLATATVRQSAERTEGSLNTSLDNLGETWTYSNLEGRKLSFGTYNSVDDKFTIDATFNFASSYVDDDGKTVTIDYTTSDYDKLVGQLNEALKQQDLTSNGQVLSKAIKFAYKDGKIQLEEVTPGSAKDINIKNDSTALTALGYVKGSSSNYEKDDDGNYTYDKNGISISEFNDNVKEEFASSGSYTKTALEAMTGQKLTFNYDGSSKEIELITEAEAKELETITDPDEKLAKMAENLQKRLNQAFGKDAIKVGGIEKDDAGKVTSVSGLTFSTKKDSSVSITSSDSGLLKNLGIVYGESNKVNLSGKLGQSALGIKDVSQYTTDKTEDGALDLQINGVQIKGLTANSSINDILSKINSSDAGVKATYLDATGQFMLVSSETGKGRQISLDSDLAQELFGQKENGVYDESLGVVEGENSLVSVSYGNGVIVDLERSSNTFNLEGMSVTVSGTFGATQKIDENGNKIDEWEYDSSAAVTFSSKADVDKVTEKVKSFFEDFNALVKEINTQVTTRPDSSYAPLTDAQKAEMDETSIKNWEDKAKQGLLFNDTTMRSLSGDVQSIFATMLGNGVTYEELQKIGITYSDDEKDGGILVFNESDFRSAMESDPELVSDIFTGGGKVTKGLMDVIDDTFTPYATRYASKNASNGSSGSYGQLIEIAGSEKKPTTLINNQIYSQLKQMNEALAVLQDRLKVEQDRYISQFTYMESMINQFNSQSSYLSQITG